MIKNLLQGNILLLIAYFVAGQITLNLAILPSGATPLWIPAGIALGAVLIWGYRLLPAIFIGDFLIAQSLFGLHDKTSIALCIAIGLQAVLQSWLAKFLLVRLRIWPTSLLHGKDIINFFLVSALIATFLPSALIISVDLFFGLLQLDNCLNAFIIWWLGSALGVILFTPLVLILFACPRNAWRMRRANVGLPMLVLFLLLLLALNLYKVNEQQQINTFFKTNANMAHALVVDEIALHRTLLKSMRAYFQNSIYVTSEEFKGYIADHSQRGFEDIFVVSWIEYVDDIDRIFFESEYGYQIVDFEPTLQRFIQAPQRPGYYVSKYFHTADSVDGQLLAQLDQRKGFDFCFARQGIQRCQHMRETGQPVIMATHFQTLGSTKNKRFVALLPVFSKSGDMNGIVAHTYEYNKFFKVLLQSGAKRWLELEITDISLPDASISLFDSQPEHEKPVAFTDIPLLISRVVEIGDRRWLFTYRPSVAFQQNHVSSVFYWVIIGAFFVLSIIGAFLLSITGREQLIRAEVKEKTREISDQVSLLEKSEAKYRHLVEGVQEDYLIYSRDINGQLTYVSPSVEVVLGYTGEEFIKHFSEYVPDNELNRLAEEYTNRALQGENVPPYEMEVVDKRGHIHTFRITKSATIDEQGKQIGVEGIAQDITQLKASHIQLEKLSLAVTHSPNAVLIIDKNGTIEYVNPKFTDVSGYSAQEIKGKWPGVMGAQSVSEATYHELWQTLLEGKEWRGELQNRKKNGDLYWAREHISPMFNTEGAITHFVVMEEDVTESRRLLKQTAYQASHDLLTGLINRREFEYRLTRIIHSAQQDKAVHSLCFLDLDQFKIVNDTCGHVGGDELLRQVSSLMQANIRARDTLARLGGDEFVILMEHCGIEQARQAANKIIHALEVYRFQWDEGTFKIGVSIGVVQINEQTTDRHKLLRQADNACYAAKDAGRNRVETYCENSERLRLRKGEIKWSSEINNALDNDRFLLYVQAIQSTTNVEQSHAYEVLVRLRMPDGSIIPSKEFFPAAERYNSATRIDRWVVETTLKWLSQHAEQWQHIHSLAINLSGQSLGDETMLRFIIQQFESSNLPAEKIRFEITETAAVANLQVATLFMQTLTKFGCRFVLDDFGSGLSSFAYLKNLHFDVLKIDGIFVKDMLDDPLDFEMVKSINQIGHVMGLETIAEFVENEQILDKLREIGVDYVQGFYIGKPIPIDSLLENKQ